IQCGGVITGKRAHLFAWKSCTGESEIDARVTRVNIEIDCQDKLSFAKTDLIEYVQTFRCVDHVEDVEMSEVKDGVEQRATILVDLDLRHRIVAIWQPLALNRKRLMDQIEPTTAAQFQPERERVEIQTQRPFRIDRFRSTV